jgi:hypothetical protein
MARPATTGKQDGPNLRRTRASEKQARLGRRKLVKTAAAALTGAVAASGYIQPSIRPLQVPVAHAFSF